MKKQLLFLFAALLPMQEQPFVIDREGKQRFIYKGIIAN